jgi:aminopeptidase
MQFLVSISTNWVLKMAISEKRTRECARSMVETCNLTRGDGVIVRGGTHTLDLLEEVALQCYRKGATPTIVVTSDRYLKRVYDEVSAKTLETTPKQYLGMVKACDVLIAIEELENPKIAEGFPRNKLQARQRGSLPIMDVIYHKTDGKKWLYAGWPTKAAAKRYGIRSSDLEKIVIGGIAVSPRTLMNIGKRLDNKFDDCSWVHVWDDKGTDFRVKVEGRRRNIDDGVISQEDYDVGDRGANLPAGELFIAPHETVGSGTIYCPVTSDRVSDKLVKDVHLEFKNGKILLNNTTAGMNGEALLSSFRECEQLDKGKYDPVRTRNVAELGIGYNPNIKKAIGYILTDEKVTGTVHVAFGSNNTYGGESESSMHWDFVTAPGVNIEVERTDGKTVQVMKKGRFL